MSGHRETRKIIYRENKSRKMNEIKNLKEKQINDFIYEIELNNASVSQIKNGLRNILGEEPGIKFNYKRELSMNETTNKMERKESELDSIEIYYSYIGDDNKPHFGTMKYII